MKKIQLSKRLSAIAGLVTPGNRIADIGCDHGYIPIYLVQQEIIPGAVAMDVNEGPLLRAKEHIEAQGLGDYIETRLSNGAAALLKGEVDTVIVAGMGGALMQRILTEGEEVFLDVSELILQPQSEIGAFRRFLYENGYHITDEDMIFEDGKYYPMMKAVPGKAPGYEDELFYFFGKELLLSKHPVLKQFLKKELETKNSIKDGICFGYTENDVRNEKLVQRVRELEEEMQQIKAALSYYEM